MDYKSELNDRQYEAVTATEGPVLVLAGAGSGKTRVLTYRIAYLVGECGISPYNIMAITFTNKAAKEMYERTERLLNGNISGMWLNTFHAACGKILRAHAERIGFTKNFVIYDDSEATALIKECQKRLNIDDKRIPHAKIKAVISKAKDELVSPAQFADTCDMKNYDSRMLAECYKMYEEQLKRNNAMDFDNMLINTIALFDTCPDVLEYYRKRFCYIMVDEYQDTNRAQYIFISKLAALHHNLCVVGDDDQSIYSFRGADIRNILEFEKENANCRVIKLEQNYRSTQHILDAANIVIAKNYGRKSKELWTAKGHGDKITHYIAENQNSEAEFVVSTIRKAVASGEMKYSDHCVLYRANALSKNIENALVKYAVPYRIYGGLRFYDRMEVKDLIAYLRVFNNPADDSALRRIINVPKRGIGLTTLGRAADIALNENTSLFNILLSAGEYTDLSRSAQKMTETALMLSELMLKADDMSIPEFIELVLNETGMLEMYERSDAGIEEQARAENLKEFISVAKEYEEEQRRIGNDDISYAGFLEYVTLSSDADTKVAGEDEDKVTLMTVHSAKGLEFPVVFMIGAEDGVFPSYRSIEESPDALDEERRLCYVAITRAMRRLYITNTEERMLYGKTTRNPPSRFLNELPAACVEEINMGRRRNYSDGMGGYGFGGTRRYGDDFESRQYERANSFLDKQFKKDTFEYTGRQENKQESGNYLTEFTAGQRVKHKKYGEGTVSKLLGEGRNSAVEIIFDTAGMKRLIIEYAKLTEV